MPNKRPALKQRRAAAAAAAAQQHQEDTEMQMDLVDKSPTQDLLMQPADLTTSTLLLNFGGPTEDGHQYVTSILKCNSVKDVFKWNEENTGAQNATVQALDAIEASSAGEYISKTAGSIGTVNHYLDNHSHEITEIQVAMGHMQDDIKNERGDLRACQRFVVGHDEAIKRQDNAIERHDNDIKRHDNDIKALQKTVETLLKANEKLNEKTDKQQDEIEKLQQKLNFQHLVIR